MVALISGYIFWALCVGRAKDFSAEYRTAILASSRTLRKFSEWDCKTNLKGPEALLGTICVPKKEFQSEQREARIRIRSAAADNFSAIVYIHYLGFHPYEEMKPYLKSVRFVFFFILRIPIVEVSNALKAWGFSTFLCPLLIQLPFCYLGPEHHRRSSPESVLLADIAGVSMAWRPMYEDPNLHYYLVKFETD